MHILLFAEIRSRQHKMNSLDTSLFFSATRRGRCKSGANIQFELSTKALRDVPPERSRGSLCVKRRLCTYGEVVVRSAFAVLRYRPGMGHPTLLTVYDIWYEHTNNYFTSDRDLLGDGVEFLYCYLFSMRINAG